MPERRPLLRRAAYLAAVTTTVGVFAGSLAGIASTQGQAKPNGDAAALARKLPPRAHTTGRADRAARRLTARLIAPAASRGRATRSPDRA
jgi:hypothetical protein